MKKYMPEWTVVILSVFLLLVNSFVNHGTPVFLNWSSGLHTAPLTSYKFWINQTANEINIINVPVVLYDDGANSPYIVTSLGTIDGKTIPVQSATFNTKIEYTKNVKLGVYQINFLLPNQGLYHFNKINYMSGGHSDSDKIDVVYEMENWHGSLPFKAVNLDTDESQNLFQMQFQNISSEKMIVTNVTTDNKTIPIIMRSVVDDSNNESTFPQEGVALLPGEMKTIKLKFSRPVNSFTELSPKLEYVDAHSKVHTISLLGIMYRGTSDPDELIRFFNNKGVGSE